MLRFDPYDPEFHANPYPIYARLRDEAPVFHNPELKFWALSRFEDVLAAHADGATFSSAGGVTIEGAEAGAPLLILKDEPEHGWAKRLVSRLFSRHRMAGLDVFIRQRAVELLEQLAEEAGDGEFDFVSRFTVILPLDVIGELLGLPPEFRAEFHHLSNITVLRGAESDPAATAAARVRSYQMLLTLAQERRANPRDGDVISMLIEDEVQDETGAKHKLSDHELAARFLEMAFAGHETVAKAIPNGAMAFHNFPDEHRKLMADRSLLPNAVDEIMRYDPPSQLQGRTTTRDVTLHGVTIPAGQRTMLLTGAATRDPRAFEEPDRFDITRPIDVKSIYFGYGVHKCLGIHLARQEIAIAFDELFKRFPDYEVDPGRITRKVLSNVRGVASLPIRLGRHA